MRQRKPRRTSVSARPSSAGGQRGLAPPINSAPSVGGSAADHLEDSENRLSRLESGYWKIQETVNVLQRDMVINEGRLAILNSNFEDFKESAIASIERLSAVLSTLPGNGLSVPPAIAEDNGQNGEKYGVPPGRDIHSESGMANEETVLGSESSLTSKCLLGYRSSEDSPRFEPPRSR